VSFLLEFFNFFGLLVWHHVCIDVFDSELFGNVIGYLFVVAGDHCKFKLCFFQFLACVKRFFADDVAECDDSFDFFFGCNDDYCFAL